MERKCLSLITSCGYVLSTVTWDDSSEDGEVEKSWEGCRQVPATRTICRGAFDRICTILNGAIKDVSKYV